MEYPPKEESEVVWIRGKVSGLAKFKMESLEGLSGTVKCFFKNLNIVLVLACVILVSVCLSLILSRPQTF